VADFDVDGFRRGKALEIGLSTNSIFLMNLCLQDTLKQLFFRMRIVKNSYNPPSLTRHWLF